MKPIIEFKTSHVKNIICFRIKSDKEVVITCWGHWDEEYLNGVSNLSYRIWLRVLK